MTVQLPVAGIVLPDDNTTAPAPAMAVTAAPPPQVVAAAGTGAITTPPGKVSVSAELRVATAASGLLSVMVSVETPPALMVAGPKALPSVGGRTGETTVSVAMAGPALLPLLVARAPMFSVLM